MVPNGWSRVAVADLCKTGRGRVISRGEIADNPGPYPVYSSQTSNNGILGFLSSYDFDGEYITWTTDGAHAGTVYYRIGQFNCTNVCGTLSAIVSDIDMRWLSAALGRVAKRYVSHNLANPKLMNNVMGEIMLPIPPLPEQQKIAAKLSTWDSAIELTEKLILAKQKRKQALMQQLLGGIGSKKVKLSSVVERVNDLVDVEAETLYREIGIRSHGKGVFHKEAVTGKSLGNKRVYHVHPACFVFNVVFAWEQAVAKTTAAEAGMIASHRFPMYRPSSDKIDLDYLLFFFKTSRGKHLLGLASPGGAGRNRTLSQSGFLNTRIPLPSLEVQKRIASTLCVADAEIDLLKLRLEKIRLQKRGLMQQLLTGKVRVSVRECDES